MEWQPETVEELGSDSFNRRRGADVLAWLPSPQPAEHLSHLPAGRLHQHHPAASKISLIKRKR